MQTWMGTLENNTFDGIRPPYGQYTLPWYLEGYAGNDFLRAGSNNDIIIAGSGDDTLDGEAGNDILFGGLGNDNFDGDSGNDIAFGGQGRDTISGGPGDDLLYGGEGNDFLYGDYSRSTSGNDTIFGGVGNDVINGFAGNDRIIGESGRDTLTGGTGSDTFVFQSLSDGIDIITDFDISQGDIITIDQVGFGATSIYQFNYDSTTGHLSFQGQHFLTLSNKPSPFAVNITLV